MLHLSRLHTHQGEKEEHDTHAVKETVCPHCGRQLMERKGVLRRLKPVSNAFVLHGHCLACHSEEITEEGEVHVDEA